MCWIRLLYLDSVRNVISTSFPLVWALPWSAPAWAHIVELKISFGNGSCWSPIYCVSPRHSAIRTPCITVSLYTDVYREVTRSVLSMLHHLVLNTDVTQSLLICNSSVTVIGQYQYIWPKDNWNIQSFHSTNL